MKENSLKKNLILKKRNDIAATLKNGKRFEYGTIRLILLKRDVGSNLKVAFLVSKKLGRKSVLRNKVKRWLREILRHNKERFPKNVFIILTPVVKYESFDYHKLKNDFLEVVQSEKFTDLVNKIVSETAVTAESK